MLEVICALAIMGLVTLAALAFLGQSFRLWEGSATWGANERRVRVVTRRLENFTGRLYTGLMPQGEEQGFNGQETEMSGLIEGDDGLILAGVRWNAAGQSLVYWEEHGGSRDEMVLTDKVDAFELRYLNKDQSWVSAWDEQVPLPLAVRWQWSHQRRKMPPCILTIRGGQSIPAP